MTSSISWIDADRLAVTLARMGRRSAGRRPPTSTEQIVERESPPAGDDAFLEEVPDRASRTPSPTTDESPDAGSSASVGSLRDRLESFVDALVEETAAGAVFVIDKDGLPLIDRATDPELLAVATSVLKMLETVRNRLLVPVGDLFELELDSGFLSLTDVLTPIGHYIVGQVAERPLPPARRRQVASDLRAVFRHEEP